MRVVLDTNVLVSAALRPGSVPARALLLAHRSGQILFSASTLAELHAVLSRDRFDRWTSAERRLELVAALVLLGEDVAVSESLTACRDPDDDKFLEVAVNGHATHIITGDQDLLALHPFRGIPIITPADFLALATPPGS